MLSIFESPKAHVGIKRQGSRQRVTMIESEGNPMDSVPEEGEAEKEIVIKVESLSDAKPISADDFELIMKQLKTIDDNTELLLNVELLKMPYLFASSYLLKILQLTPSWKTQLAIIGSIGPRLTDPTSKADEIKGLFRYSQEQATVEEILKQRQNAIQASKFKQTGGLSRSSINAGRGGAGRGTGASRQSMIRASSGIDIVDCSDLSGTKVLTNPPKPIAAPNHDSLEDSVTDVEQASEKSDGTPGDGVDERLEHAVAESVAPRDIQEPLKDTKKQSTFVVKSRRVTLKTAAEIQEEKLAAAAASLHDPNHNQSVKPSGPDPVTTRSRSMAETSRHPPHSTAATHGKPEDNKRGSVLNRFHAADTTVPTVEKASVPAPSARKVMDSKGWLKKPEPNEQTPAPKTSEVVGTLGVARKLFGTVDNKDGEDNAIVNSRDSADAVSMPTLLGAPVREYVRRNSGEILAADVNRTLVRSFSDRIDSEAAALAKLEQQDQVGGPSSLPPPCRRSTYAAGTPKAQSFPNHYSSEIVASSVKVSELSRAYLGGSSSQQQPTYLSTPAVTRRRSTSTEGTAYLPPPSTVSKPNAGPQIAPGLDPKYLISMLPADPVAFDANGNALYSYIELVRRNFLKSYGDLVQTELERYLSDAEFLEKMGLSRGDFYNLPKWKQVSQKKALLLF